MKTAYLTIALLAGVFASTFAHAVAPAAQLKQISGSVLLNTGETYKTANEGAPLYVGDRLMVMEGGSMVMVYQDGCVAEFRENQVITVKNTSTCAGGAADVNARRPLYAEPLGGSNSRYGTPAGAPETNRTGAYVVGGIALVGLGAALAPDSDDSTVFIIEDDGGARPPISAE